MKCQIIGESRPCGCGSLALPISVPPVCLCSLAYLAPQDLLVSAKLLSCKNDCAKAVGYTIMLLTRSFTCSTQRRGDFPLGIPCTTNASRRLVRWLSEQGRLLPNLMTCGRAPGPTRRRERGKRLLEIVLTPTYTPHGKQRDVEETQINVIKEILSQ